MIDPRENMHGVKSYIMFGGGGVETESLGREHTPAVLYPENTLLVQEIPAL